MTSTRGTAPPVRAYLPATFETVAQLRDRGEVPPGPAYVVTPGLRADLGEDDEELLEYVAFGLAADASLDLLRDRPELPRRRVVIAVDAPVVLADGEQTATARARLAGPVHRASVAAIHVDGAEAAAEVATAAAAGASIDHELEWYDPSELDVLLSD